MRQKVEPSQARRGLGSRRTHPLHQISRRVQGVFSQVGGHSQAGRSPAASLDRPRSSPQGKSAYLNPQVTLPASLMDKGGGCPRPVWPSALLRGVELDIPQKCSEYSGVEV